MLDSPRARDGDTRYIWVEATGKVIGETAKPSMQEQPKA